MIMLKKRPVPYALVFEEPAPRLKQFEFHKSGEVAGKIIGINSTPEHTTYPKICVVSLPSAAYVQVSCVTAEEPYRPHPHSLVHQRQDGNCERFCKGVINVQVRPHYPVAEFNDIWLQCIPREGVKQALAIKRDMGVNPLHTPEWQDSEIAKIDLHSVRLCFQVFIKNKKTEKLEGICTVVSEPICNVEGPNVDMVSSDM